MLRQVESQKLRARSSILKWTIKRKLLQEPLLSADVKKCNRLLLVTFP